VRRRGNSVCGVSPVSHVLTHEVTHPIHIVAIPHSSMREMGKKTIHNICFMLNSQSNLEQREQS
jgi:hypothetical protein